MIGDKWWVANDWLQMFGKKMIGERSKTTFENIF